MQVRSCVQGRRLTKSARRSTRHHHLKIIIRLRLLYKTSMLKTSKYGGVIDFNYHQHLNINHPSQCICISVAHIGSKIRLIGMVYTRHIRQYRNPDSWATNSSLRHENKNLFALLFFLLRFWTPCAEPSSTVYMVSTGK